VPAVEEMVMKRGRMPGGGWTGLGLRRLAP
jgi:hypothetical protein